jgi:hypothetical protein
MPRFVVLVVVGFFNGGCWFSADYRAGVPCRDHVCPSSLSCVADVCVDQVPHDGAGSDAPPGDAKPDAPSHALTCADPQPLASGVAVTGTTSGHPNSVGATCNAVVMNGFDAVYKLDATLGQTLTITASSADYPIAAYAVAPCTMTTSCTGNTYATQTTAATITIPATTTYFIVVDGINAGLAGGYTMTATLN